jgi:hypothetical protein
LANIVWTAEGMGRLMTSNKPGATTSQVELIPSGQIKDLAPDKLGIFFRDIVLKKSTLKETKAVKTVDFTLTLKANYAI